MMRKSENFPAVGETDPSAVPSATVLKRSSVSLAWLKKRADELEKRISEDRPDLTREFDKDG
jgi:hypothetical protein